MSAVALVENDRRSLPPVEGPGGTFCSPWCGFKCTKAAYERAHREAVILAAALGPDWEPNVWENCGWHFEAFKGHARVTPDTRGSAIAGTYSIVGYTGWCNFGVTQAIERGATPGEAIAAARASMEAKIAELQSRFAEAFA